MCQCINHIEIHSVKIGAKIGARYSVKAPTSTPMRTTTGDMKVLLLAVREAGHFNCWSKC